MKVNVQDCGRSMIEMLGVLSIVGVLSVGGLVGYSKAMMRYRINKTMSEIALIAGNVRAFFAPQRSFTGLDSGTEAGINLIKKTNIVPANMISDTPTTTNTFTSYILNEWGDIMRIAAFNTSAFVVSLHSVPTEACIELSSQDWYSANVPVLYINNTFHTSEAGAVNYTLKTPADMVKVTQACSSDDGLSDLVLYFDEDINKGAWPEEL